MSASESLYANPPLIRKTVMEMEEVSEIFIEDLRNMVFQRVEERDQPSIHEQWFRSVSQGPNAIRSMGTNGRLLGRYICWKKGKDFDPENIFFRTIDTARVLPMALADFRIQWYCHPAFLEWLDTRKKADAPEPRKLWKTLSAVSMMWEILVMRNMHDYGGADIPIIVTNWSPAMYETALEHWVELSKDQWSLGERERRARKMQLEFSQENPLPCFYQVDLVVRALLSDKAVDYVPRFIIFKPQDPNMKARALFSHPSFQPPAELIANFPTGCGAADCDNPDCSAFDFSACRSLTAGSSMVRKDKFPVRTVRCNFWPCQLKDEDPTKPCPFVRCTKCKEVMYCSKEHQVHDWAAHKRVCDRPQTT